MWFFFAKLYASSRALQSIRPRTASTLPHFPAFSGVTLFQYLVKSCASGAL